VDLSPCLSRIFVVHGRDLTTTARSERDPGSQVDTAYVCTFEICFLKKSSRKHHIKHHLATTCPPLATTWLQPGYNLATPSYHCCFETYPPRPCSPPCFASKMITRNNFIMLGVPPNCVVQFCDFVENTRRDDFRLTKISRQPTAMLLIRGR